MALKSAMAVTGVVLVLYLLAHMYGNLMILGGQQTFDEYAHHLREIGEPMLPHTGVLWIVRVVLLASILVHAYSAVALWRRAKTARGHRYAVKKSAQGPAARYATHTMRWGGVVIVFFVVFHILHLTTNDIAPGGASDSPFQRVVNGFQPEFWYITLFYVVAVLAVGLHLRHGIWSAMATLGANKAYRERWMHTLSTAIAVVLTVGFLIGPLSVSFGLVG